ncbi:unnamed protein product [Rotaria magnacalcarata]|uniref:DUF4590 domain-containing protein n=1 Tax=Rotaria magnacalcarata TaxID=392030 RepID=A0A816N4K5_9BILA|nr:unnamed protein product [Rotaria magnacalcarata]CAF4096993.1 unnamed protein product [Rotaria magnacalcarata]
MTEIKKSKILTHKQLEAILNTDHIWQHLIKVGFIDNRGDVISKVQSKRRLPRRHTLNNKRHHITYTSQSTVRSVPKCPVQKHSDTNDENPSSPSNCSPTRRRLKSASIVQSKQTNKTANSARFSSSTQATFIENVLIRRAVSPKIMLAENRCLVTMKYFGEEMNIEYDRTLFIPQDDEIIIMQQHCGGENLMVFKGLLKRRDDFAFESRRHTDYPFALAFYVNGVISNRLSVCCENRVKNETLIGGKRCVFSILSIEKSRPCRKCRFEQRMAKLFEEKPELKPRKNQYDTSTKNSSTSREANSAHKENSCDAGSLQEKKSDVSSSKSTISDSKNDKTSEFPTLQSKPIKSDDEASQKSCSPISSSEKIETNKIGNAKISQSPTLRWKPNESDSENSKTLLPPISSSKQNDSDTIDHTETNESATLPPKITESVNSDVKTNESVTSSSKVVEPDKETRFSTNNSPLSNSKILKPVKSEDSEINESINSSIDTGEPEKKSHFWANNPPLSNSKILKPVKSEGSEINDSINSSIGTNESEKKNLLTKSAPRISSPESFESDTSSSEDRRERTRVRPKTAPVNQPKSTSSPNPYSTDFEKINENIDSSFSSSHDDHKLAVPASSSSKNRINKTSDLDRVSIVSSETDEDEEESTIHEN